MEVCGVPSPITQCTQGVRESTAVLSDLYENPVQVNTQELFDMAQQRWQEQMNAWLVEYNQTSQQR